MSTRGNACFARTIATGVWYMQHFGDSHRNFTRRKKSTYYQVVYSTYSQDRRWSNKGFPKSWVLSPSMWLQRWTSPSSNVISIHLPNHLRIEGETANETNSIAFLAKGNRQGDQTSGSILFWVVQGLKLSKCNHTITHITPPRLGARTKGWVLCC